MTNPEGQYTWNEPEQKGNLSREDGELGRGIQQSGPEQNQNSQPHGGLRERARNIEEGLEDFWGELFGKPWSLIELPLPPGYPRAGQSLSSEQYAALVRWANARRSLIEKLMFFVMKDVFNRPPFPIGMVVFAPQWSVPGTTPTNHSIGLWLELGPGTVKGGGGILGIIPGFGSVKIESLGGPTKSLWRGLKITTVVSSWELEKLNHEMVGLYPQIGNTVTPLDERRTEGTIGGFAYSPYPHRILAAMVFRGGEEGSMVLVPIKRLE
jgi:hypothetical protein